MPHVDGMYSRGVREPTQVNDANSPPGLHVDVQRGDRQKFLSNALVHTPQQLFGLLAALYLQPALESMCNVHAKESNGQPALHADRHHCGRGTSYTVKTAMTCIHVLRAGMHRLAPCKPYRVFLEAWHTGTLKIRLECQLQHERQVAKRVTAKFGIWSYDFSSRMTVYNRSQ